MAKGVRDAFIKKDTELLKLCILFFSFSRLSARSMENKNFFFSKRIIKK